MRPEFVVLSWMLTLCFFDVEAEMVDRDGRRVRIELPGWGSCLHRWLRSRGKKR